ncbi:MAG: hypothetical protein ACLGH7_02930, partial [Actinomycetes bacterium]
NQPKNHAHHGVAAQQINQSQYIIGINKLGTLLSSQTTDTFEYPRNNSQKEFLFRISSLQCFISYFILVHFCKSGFFRDLLRGMNPPSTMGSNIFGSTQKRGKNCFS